MTDDNLSNLTSKTKERKKQRKKDIWLQSIPLKKTDLFSKFLLTKKWGGGGECIKHRLNSAASLIHVLQILGHFV